MIKSQQSRPMCAKCGVLPSRKNGTSSLGFQRWHRYCNSCSKSSSQPVQKDTQCSVCNFISRHRCQICFVDGQSICQNCNALRLLEKKTSLTVDATVSIWDIRL